MQMATLDCVGGCNPNIYGTHEAAATWQSKVTSVMLNACLKKYVINPCIFSHGSRELETIINCENSISSGEVKDLFWFGSDARCVHYFNNDNRVARGI